MSEETIRVLLAEDHHVVRRALQMYLQQVPWIEVVGEVADGEALLAAVAQHQPDVLMMDVQMPNHQPLVAVGQIRERHPAVKIVVLSAYKTSEYVVGLFKAGVDGYVLKDDPADAPIQAIRQVTRGEQWVSPQAAVVLADHIRNTKNTTEAGLTERELEVLILIAGGCRNEEIATALVISEHTVRNHMANIFKKLDVATRIEAVVYALSLDLLSLDQIEKEGRSHST